MFIADQDPQNNVYRKIVTNLPWVVIPRFFEAIVNGLVFFIVARLINPGEIGLFAMVALVFFSVDFFTEVGIYSMLVQRNVESSSYLDTAWVIQIVRGFIIFIILYAVSPLIALFFHTPQLSIFLRVFSFVYVINGFSNVGILFFSKKLQFHREFVVNFWPKLVFGVTTVLSCYFLRNAWCFLIGQFCASIFGIILSFRMSDFRPSFTFNIHKARDFFSFGRWMFLSMVVIFFMLKIDIIFISKYLGVWQLGLYHVSLNIANLIYDGVFNFYDKIFFPLYSILNKTVMIIGDLYITFTGFIMLIMGCYCGFVLLFSDNIVQLLLGNKWVGIVAILKILAIASFLKVPGIFTGNVYRSIGRPDLIFKTSFLKFLVIFILLFQCRQVLTLQVVAYLSLLTILLVDPLSYYIVLQETKLSFGLFIKKIFLIPIVSTLTTVLFVSVLRLFLPGPVFTRELLCMVFFLVLYYFVVVMLAKVLLGCDNYFMELKNSLKSIPIFISQGLHD